MPTCCSCSALPTKPLHSIALSDADAASSLSFVKQKLNDASIKIEISGQDATFIERLGGRSSDLESVGIPVYHNQGQPQAEPFHSSSTKSEAV